MRYIKTFIFLLITTWSFGQNNIIVADSANQLFINGNGGVASTGITQKFMNKFIFPDYISDDLKAESAKKLSISNYFGGEGFGELKLLFGANPDSSNSAKFFGIGFGTSIEGNLKFTDDLFNLTFYGNKPYAGQTLSFDDTRFNLSAYSFIEFTLGKTKKLKNKNTFSAWADIGLVLGHNATQFNFEEASLYTEPSGDYLELKVNNSSIMVSDTASTNFIQGIGGKVDLNFIYQTESSKAFFSVENIGGIAWNNATTADIDTTFRFEGIEVGNIFELSDSVFNEITTFDSLYNSEKGTVFNMLPITFTGYYKKELGLFNYDLLARYRLFSNYRPFVRGGIYLKSTPVVHPGFTVGYGGYGDLIAGINTDVFLGHLKLQIGTNNILGAIVPSFFTSLDGYIGLNLQF